MKITAGILAGGKSGRMGSDKARLPHSGQSFLSHLARELADYDELLVSVGTAERRAAPYALVADELEDFGPVEGVYQLLRRARNPYVLVVATDMQRLTGEFLRRFTGELRAEDRCLVARTGELLEPLCSVYHKDALPYLEEMRRQGIRRPRALFAKLPTHYVDIEALGYGAEIVENINTRADYDRFLQQNP